jgi:hypothetical protein
MMLLTKALRKRLPPLYHSEKRGDPLVVCKFFDPTGSWTWYAIEGEEQEDGDVQFFGLVDGFEPEMGYFSLSELQQFRGRFGLGIERDMYWTPVPLSQVKGR